MRILSEEDLFQENLCGATGWDRTPVGAGRVHAPGSCALCATNCCDALGIVRGCAGLAAWVVAMNE